MLSIPIQHTKTDWQLALEKWNDKLRIIILKQQEEMACRKESKKKLEKFIQSEGATIFKGRIQLVSEKEIIRIYLKKIGIGSITKADFSSLLARCI